VPSTEFAIVEDMVTRGDVRLITVIVLTALATSLCMVIAMKVLTSDHPSEVPIAAQPVPPRVDPPVDPCTGVACTPESNAGMCCADYRAGLEANCSVDECLLQNNTPACCAKYAAPAPADDCDEVSCVLNNYEGQCCRKFTKGAASAPTAGDVPEGLDRAMISTGVAAIKAKISACGDRTPAKGKVTVHVKVAPAGRVASVTIAAEPDAVLGACVAAEMRKATFAKTQAGGTFRYPFVF
jgi:hypothetical protein